MSLARPHLSLLLTSSSPCTSSLWTLFSKRLARPSASNSLATRTTRRCYPSTTCERCTLESTEAPLWTSFATTLEKSTTTRSTGKESLRHVPLSDAVSCWHLSVLHTKALITSLMSQLTLRRPEWLPKFSFKRK